MELVVENGWNGNGLMLDRLASFRRGIDEATDPKYTGPGARGRGQGCAPFLRRESRTQSWLDVQVEDKSR